MFTFESLFTDLFPREAQQRENAMTNRFVHYTSADVAMSIIQNKEVWMRNARTMNDYSEIEYGKGCLDTALSTLAGKRLIDVLMRTFHVESILSNLSEHMAMARENTYLTCISEHDASEDEYGRLSMWRAYGGATGVALVVKNTPFIEPADGLGAFTFPVSYCTPNDYTAKIAHIAQVVESRAAVYKSNPVMFIGWFFGLMQNSMLCAKHPGFAEEREWRVTYLPIPVPSQHILSGIRSVRGTPQKIYRLQLRDIPEANFYGASISHFIDRIIIGPTTSPNIMREAFVELLRENGVHDAIDRVTVSSIPLRHYF